MIKPEGFIVIDGTSGIEEQQELVRDAIVKLLTYIEQQKVQEPIQEQTTRL